MGLMGCWDIVTGQKIILSWPPTTHSNCEIVRRGKPLSLECSRLEGGIIALVDEESPALILFAGTIHATVTLKGGVLIGINWLAANGYTSFEVSLRNYELPTRHLGDASSALSLYAQQIFLSLDQLEDTYANAIIIDWQRKILPLLRALFVTAAASADEIDALKELHEILTSVNELHVFEFGKLDRKEWTLGLKRLSKIAR
jgi:hypothetical protein